MIKYSKFILALLMASLFVLTSCKEEEYELGELTTPSNIEIAYEIVGANDTLPYGDGSGVVNFVTTADNEITFNYIFGDGSANEISASGIVSHPYSINGIHKYQVMVKAIGTGGLISSKTIEIEVWSDFSDEQAVTFLTGGSSKKWYWAANQLGHAGMGTQSEDYGNKDYTFASWWSAAPFEKTCMYDAEFEFTKTTNGLTFEQLAGPAFVPGTYAGVIGVEPDACYGDDVVSSLYGVKNVTLSPSSSRAAIDGQYRGTTMTFSDDGFMCWWVGNSEYDIIEVTENVIKVRVKEDETVAWYHIFVSEKPVE